jgi:hypothetical protein
MPERIAAADVLKAGIALDSILSVVPFFSASMAYWPRPS